MKMLKSAGLGVVAFAVLGLLTTTGQAAVIGGVTALETSSQLPTRTGSDAVDGTGLTGNVHNGTADDMWLTGGNGCCGTGADPELAFGRKGHIVMDLGNIYNVTDFTVWNYREGSPPGGNPRGANSVIISVSNTNTMLGTAAAIPSGGDISTLATNTFAISNADPDTGENHVEAFQARYVRIDIVTHHGDGLELTGLAEIQFNGTAVPEPSSLALAGLGLLGLCGWGVRRRAKR